MNWPDPPAAGPIGDGRFATACDRPESVEHAQQVIAGRVAEGLAIFPQGGATALDHGSPPRRPGVVLDTRALRRVIDYPHADMTITVEAGITLGELRHTLAEHRQRLLIDAPDADRATLGGIYATNTCGPRRYGAGRPRDQILGVGFVNADGELIRGGGRVVKNVAGYDFPRLLTGSMGTLGLIVEMTLKVRPTPETSALVWASFERPEEIAGRLDTLNVSQARPIALELLNPEGASLVGGPLGLPAGRWTIVVGVEDNRESVAWQVERLREELAGATSVEVRQDADAEPLWDALTAFPTHAQRPVTISASVRPSDVAGFTASFPPTGWAIASHAGNGIVRAHAPEAPHDELAPEVDRLRALAVRHGGNLMLLRCPTEWKSRLRVWGEPRPDWAVCARIKAALDPEAVMNPGRFVGTI